MNVPAALANSFKDSESEAEKRLHADVGEGIRAKRTSHRETTGLGISQTASLHTTRERFVFMRTTSTIPGEVM